MPFIQPEPFTFFNIKFTDHGRRAASQGKITFSKIILSDREIDYSIDRDGNYNIFNNRVLDLSEFYPDVPGENFGNIPPTSTVFQPQGDGLIYNATTNFNVGTEKITITGSSSSTTISNFVKGTKTLAYSSNSSNWGTNKITFAGGGYSPVVNDVVTIPWVSPDYSSGSYNPTTMPQNDPCVLSFYKIISAVTAGSVYLVDRPIPNFATGAFPTLTCQFFRDNMIESFYGSGKTSDPGVWNMNIVRTKTVMGTQLSVPNKVSGYTTYGSIEYNGTKKYFGFSDNLPIFGVIHYTNKWTGNTYGEQFVEKTFEMNLPGIMWHHNLNAYYNNILSSSFTSFNSSGETWGLYLSDFAGDTYYDPVVKSTYRELRDGRSINSFSVGRVYHKLQLIVVTDQELLTALTYKSNRNYTLPDFEVSLSRTPQIGLYPANGYSATTMSGYTANGLVENGYDYFVTYIAENSTYSSSVSMGHAPALPCGYIKKITGFTDSNGNKQYLKVRFPNSNSFPYMRDDSELLNILYNGTGWNANTVQLLVNKQLSYKNYDIGNVPYQDWKRVSDSSVGGNGVYRASDYGLNTIDPKVFNSYEFVISEEDFNTGSTYTINSGLTANQSYLNFGDECFVYGTIKTGIAAVVYKTRIQAYLDDSELNGSNNPTFDPEIDTATYITEIAVLDELGNVVAAGKPTYPILKSNIRWLTLQLDIDF
jgi:hypothetical protein